eukprot:2428232-Amphidinium_carterae.1
MLPRPAAGWMAVKFAACGGERANPSGDNFTPNPQAGCVPPVRDRMFQGFPHCHLCLVIYHLVPWASLPQPWNSQSHCALRVCSTLKHPAGANMADDEEGAIPIKLCMASANEL